MKVKCYIGTSGWSYDHWEGVFYPEGTRAEDRLPYYIQHLNTVEVNNTFYHLPTVTTFEGWRDVAPKGFIYSLKGSRFITHMKKLKDGRKYRITAKVGNKTIAEMFLIFGFMRKVIPIL